MAGVAPLTAQDAAGEHPGTRVDVAGWLQPRYERWTVQPRGDSVFLRRARVDVRGQLFGPRLTFRLQFDVLRSGRVRDAYLDFAIHPLLAVRVGQFSVPFGWRVSPRRDPFTERDVAASQFGSPSRDIGLLLHGAEVARRLEFALGVLEGAGARAGTPSGGAMITSRVAVATVGTVPREETDPDRSEPGCLVVGAGVQHAARNALQDWALGRSRNERRADWTTFVVDLVAQRRGGAAVIKHYVRSVDPVDDALAPYRGSATALIAAVALAPAVEFVARRTWSQADRRDPGTRRRDWSIGFNLFHRSHDLKTRFHYRAETSRNPLGDTFRVFVVEVSWMF